jgi:hypothetical protein
MHASPDRAFDRFPTSSTGGHPIRAGAPASGTVTARSLTSATWETITVERPTDCSDDGSGGGADDGGGGGGNGGRAGGGGAGGTTTGIPTYYAYGGAAFMLLVVLLSS